MTNENQNLKQKPARNVYALYYWVLGPLLALLIWSVWFAPKPQEVPRELQGTWRSQDPRYSERSLEISPITVSFGTGEGKCISGLIRHVNVEHEGADALVTIQYSGDDGEQTVALQYDENKQALRLKNQPSVTWQKQSKQTSE
jgi:hypothetical protein